MAKLAVMPTFSVVIPTLGGPENVDAGQDITAIPTTVPGGGVYVSGRVNSAADFGTTTFPYSKGFFVTRLDGLWHHRW